MDDHRHLSGGQSGGTQKVIWALSIEEDGTVQHHGGHGWQGVQRRLNSYWHTVHGIETWNSSHWHETHYSANSAGIESLLLAHPVIFDPTSEVHTSSPLTSWQMPKWPSAASLPSFNWSRHGKIYFQNTTSEANSTQASTPAKVLYNRNSSSTYTRAN